jgi:hypothetical protein
MADHEVQSTQIQQQPIVNGLQPVYVPVGPQPVVMQPGTVQPAVVQPVVIPGAVNQQVPQSLEVREHREDLPLDLKVVSHSNLYYWWPTWAVAFLMAAWTYWEGRPNAGGSVWEMIHSSSNPGILFFLTLFVVILITNVSVRGLASGMVFLGIALTAVLFAYFGWWDAVLRWLGNLKIYLNLGAYLTFGTVMFVVWALTIFVFDKFTFWRIKPGQITHEFVFGAGSRSYDTDGMLLEKHRDDLFRHWLLGLGSGDLVVETSGANRERIDIPNVFFLGTKVEAIQRMIATKPDEFSHVAIK